jgi:hypothetical protein
VARAAQGAVRRHNVALRYRRRHNITASAAAAEDGCSCRRRAVGGSASASVCRLSLAALCCVLCGLCVHGWCCCRRGCSPAAQSARGHSFRRRAHSQKGLHADPCDTSRKTPAHTHTILICDLTPPLRMSLCPVLAALSLLRGWCLEAFLFFFLFPRRSRSAVCRMVVSHTAFTQLCSLVLPRAL